MKKSTFALLMATAAALSASQAFTANEAPSITKEDMMARVHALRATLGAIQAKLTDIENCGDSGKMLADDGTCQSASYADRANSADNSAFANSANTTDTAATAGHAAYTTEAGNVEYTELAKNADAASYATAAGQANKVATTAYATKAAQAANATLAAQTNKANNADNSTKADNSAESGQQYTMKYKTKTISVGKTCSGNSTSHSSKCNFDLDEVIPEQVFTNARISNKYDAYGGYRGVYTYDYKPGTSASCGAWAKKYRTGPWDYTWKRIECTARMDTDGDVSYTINRQNTSSGFTIKDIKITYETPIIVRK